MRAPPKLSKHATGQWFVKWGGKTHYLGTDQKAAEAKYAEHLSAWSAWRQQRTGAIEASRPSAGGLVVAGAVVGWLTARAGDISPRLLRGYRADIRPVLDAAGSLPVSALDAAKLNAIKADLRAAGKSPSTINHTLRATKQMLQWCMDYHPRSCPPMNLRAVKLAREPKRSDLAKTPAQIAEYIAAAEVRDARLGPWLRLGFLTGCRVGELVRLVRGEGRWHKPDKGRCVFATRNKTAHRTDEPERFIVLSEQACIELSRCGRHWATPGGLSHAWHDLFGPQPRPIDLDDGEPTPRGIDEEHKHLPALPIKCLRHSCYQALLDADVEFNRARLLMGHSVQGSWGNYANAPWHTWRADMQRVILPDVTHSAPPSGGGGGAAPERHGPRRRGGSSDLRAAPGAGG